VISDANGAGSPPEPPNITLLRALNVLLRHRRVIILLPLALMAAAVVYKLTRPPEYTSGLTFMPQRSRSASQAFGGLAAQLGIDVRTGSATESPSFYADLIRSRAVLEQVLRTPISRSDEAAAPAVTLQQLYASRARAGTIADYRALDRLRSRLAINTSRTSDLVHVAVTDGSPRVAHAIGAAIIDAINSFNLRSRQSQAREERRFVEARLNEARTELRRAETELARFLARNARFERAPLLMLEHDRLQREVGWRQQVFTSLAESYEQARIDEVRDIPVITVVEPPSVPARRDARGTLRLGLVAGVLGLLLAVPWAFTREFLRASSAVDADDLREFTRLRRETALDLRRPWRVLSSQRVRP